MRTVLIAAASALALPGLVAVATSAGAGVSVHSSARLEPTGTAREDAGGDDRRPHRTPGDDDFYRQRGFTGHSYYGEPGYDEPVSRSTRIWRGDDGRTYCRHRDGTTGLLIGGAAGGAIGHEIVGRHGDRTLGAILGAIGGALLGREVERSAARCR